jgi:hypothetical protein
MRVIYQGPPVPAQNKQPPHDSLVDGTAQFEIILLEAGDAAQPGNTTVSDWRARASAGLVRVPTGRKLIGVPETAFPISVLSGLPDNAPVLLSWTWHAAGHAHQP